MKGMSAEKNSKSSSVWWTEVNKSQVTLAFVRSETGNKFSVGILDLRFLANQKALLVILLYPFTIRVYPPSSPILFYPWGPSDKATGII